MATYYWTGASGTDYHWATAGNWTPSGPPGNGDIAIFDNVSTNCTVGGGPASTALTELIFTSRYRGNFGASGAAITSVSATMLTVESSGAELWFGTGSISRAIIYPRSTGANAVNFVASDLGYIRCVSGQISIDASCTMGSMLILQPSPEGAFIGPEVIVASGVTWSANQKAQVCGGRLQLYDGPNGTTDDWVKVTGGELWIRGGTTDNVLVDGGICRHDAGTVTEAHLSDGFWDGTRSGESRTLTTLYQYGGESDFTNAAGYKPGTFIWLGGKTTLPQQSYTP